jgi:hypothetical protein
MDTRVDRFSPMWPIWADKAERASSASVWWKTWVDFSDTLDENRRRYEEELRQSTDLRGWQ